MDEFIILTICLTTEDASLQSSVLLGLFCLINAYVDSLTYHCRITSPISRQYCDSTFCTMDLFSCSFVTYNMQRSCLAGLQKSCNYLSRWFIVFLCINKGNIPSSDSLASTRLTFNILLNDLQST